jgi:methylated-DNA-[protein]-cysteine S-methyltransferase
MKLFQDIFETRLGWMGVLASETGLRKMTLPQSSPEECFSMLGPDATQAVHFPERFIGLKKKLESYFDGNAVNFDDEPLDFGDATEFHKAAWRACRSIPAGETRTYKWLAAQAGRPKAPRAAGQSMARNRLPIIIPCHRVIAADGSLRGFGKGTTRLDLKERLLQMEAGFK